MDKAVLRGVLLLVDSAVSLALASYSWGFELKLGVPTPGTYLSERIFGASQPGSIMGYVIVRVAIDWVFKFSSTGKSGCILGQVLTLAAKQS